MAHPGVATSKLNSAASTNATLVKNAAGEVHFISVMNASASSRYLRLFNKATIPVPGTDTPDMVVQIPAGVSKELEFGPFGMPFSLGIGFAITGAAPVLDNTAVAAGDVQVNITYK
jgi:hypothetical protein